MVFESCPPRHLHKRKSAFRKRRVFVSAQVPIERMAF